MSGCVARHEAARPAPRRSGGRRAGGAGCRCRPLLLLALTAAMAWLLLSALTARPAVTPEATAFATRLRDQPVRLRRRQVGLVRRRPCRAAGCRLRDDHRRAAPLGDCGRPPPAKRQHRCRAHRGRAHVGRAPAPAVRARGGRGAGPVRSAAGRAGAAPHRRPDPARRAVGLRRAGPGERRGAADRYRGRLRRLPRARRRDLAAGAGRDRAAVRDAGVVRLARPPRPAGPDRRGRRRLVSRRAARALAATDNLPGGGATAIPDLGPLDWASRSPRSAAGVGGLWVRWLRPLAVAFLATGLAAAASPETCAAPSCSSRCHSVRSCCRRRSSPPSPRSTAGKNPGCSVAR